jgi:antitoxin component of MazEF toxin-antitoxin module
MARPTTKDNSSDFHIQSKIKQWGNSLGIRIPKDIRNSLHLSDGSRVVISLNKKSKKIIIENITKNKPIHELSNNLNLSELTKNISKKNRPTKAEAVSGIVGKEVW